MQFLHTFQPAQWTIIHFWSNSESSGRKQISPPPGLPVPETFSGDNPLDMTIDQIDGLPTPTPDTAPAHMPDAPTLVLDTTSPWGHLVVPPAAPSAPASSSHELGVESPPQGPQQQRSHKRKAEAAPPPEPPSRSPEPILPIQNDDQDETMSQMTQPDMPALADESDDEANLPANMCVQAVFPQVPIVPAVQAVLLGLLSLNLTRQRIPFLTTLIWRTS